MLSPSPSLALSLSLPTLTLTLTLTLTPPLRAHFKMMPDVPIVGWDVAFTPRGVFLLEVNLSCNFFRGSFDANSYICFVDDFFRDTEREEGRRKAAKGAQGGKVRVT